MKNTLAVMMTFISLPAFAEGWGASAGYQNPVGSDIGVNLLHQWTNVVWEIGIGHIATGKNSGGFSGDTDLKYLFSPSGWGPFVEGGVGYGLGSNGKSLGVGTGGAFAGGGIWNMGSKFFFSAGADYVLDGKSWVAPTVCVGVKF